ncbi:MAG: PEP-CTERM sorting domain-containing protein [Leptolyngbya sp. PLA1]|nr:PEP-CTERM sorting domain-containing protein [Leptolyngbya sp. PLA1]
MSFRNILSVRAICIAAVAGLASAASASVTFSGTSGNLAAAAEFDISAGSLIIRLTNTSTADVMVPADILTGVYFDVAGSSLSLTPVSATLYGGSVVLFGSNGGGNMGGEFAYASSLVGGPGAANYGISSSGLGLFGNPNFNGPNLGGPAGVDGLQYGITSAGDNPATGNTPVTGTNELIKNSVEFRLSGLPQGFNLSSIGNVWFQYGTALNEPQVSTPAPGALALLGLGGLIAGRRRR